jgi:hypothetical protein
MVNSVVRLCSTAARYPRGRFAVPVAVGAMAVVIAPTASAAASVAATPVVTATILVGKLPLGVGPTR